MDDILERFLAQAPIAVMLRAAMNRVIGHSALNDIFERSTAAQYTRELTFGTLARLMIQVVFSTFPSVNAAYQRNRQEIPVSIASVYNKLNGLELGVSVGLVAETASEIDRILRALPDFGGVPVEGLRLRTLDGNFLAGTDHRIDCLRGCGAAALPGMSLVVRDGQSGLLTDLIPCEDAYTNERALHPAVLDLVRADDLWLMDRNFCTEDYTGGIAQRDAFFLVRHHAGTKLHPLGPEQPSGRGPSGAISEQPVRVGALHCRCIIIRLEEPLEDGTTELRLLTNVPPERLSAERAAQLYRTRWCIETAFQELTVSLRCEINTLGYPRAALFGFALAVVAYNLLVLTRSALASGLGEELGGSEAVSSYQMAVEVAAVDKGLSIAVPESVWGRFVAMTTAEFAGWLYAVARQVDWRSYAKRPRGPKKPTEVKRTRRGAHRSTARELKKCHGKAP